MAGISESKRSRKDDELESKENEESGGEDEEMDRGDEEFVDEMMQLDLEGRKPENLHYNGIRTLLHQVFLKLNLNVSSMADWIIKHNSVGSVLQQLEPSDEEGDIADDAGDDNSIVISITTVIDVNNEQEFAKQLKTVLIEQCKSSASKLSKQFEEIINNADNRIGFLINERMIGLPPHVTVFESLWKDLEKAKKSEAEYNFTHYLLFSKILRPVVKASKRNSAQNEQLFMNVEEELFHKNSLLNFEFSVKDQCDAALSGIWDDDESESYEPFRSVMILTADKIPIIMSQMAAWIASSN